MKKKYADHEEFDRIMRDVAEILEQMEHAEVRRLITERQGASWRA